MRLVRALAPRGRRARHGAAEMAPDYAHWHGTYEVAQDFYEKVIPEAREIVARAVAQGKVRQVSAVQTVLDGILARPEHAWYLDEKAKVVKARWRGRAGETDGR